MTFEPIRAVRGMSDDELGTLNLLLKQLEDKRPRNLLRASVYDGKQAIRQISSVVPPQYYQMGLVLGWIPKGVDSMGRRCRLERFTWADGDLDSLGAHRLMDANHLTTRISMAVTSSLIHSVSFLVTVRGEEGEPDALILARDALNATGDWNLRRGSLDNLVSVTERVDDRPTKVVLYLYGLTINAEKRSGGWVVTNRSTHPWGVPAEPMVHRPRLGREFGSSRITRPAMAAQNAGLRTLIRLEGHMDVYSFPELMLLGADGSVFKDENGNTLPTWRVMLGRLKGIPDDEDATNPRADVKHIPSASPEPHLGALNTYARMCARELSLPDSALALSDIANPVSAEAYDGSQYELIAEAEGSMSDWSTPLNRTFARALAIQNNVREIPDEWLSINADWREAQHLTRAASADAGAKQLGTLPWLAETEVALELLGIPPEQARRALAERSRLQAPGALAQMLEASAGAQGPSSLESAQELRTKFEALGIAARAGVDQDEAARLLGLEGIKFTGVPVSVRQERSEAAELEDR